VPSSPLLNLEGPISSLSWAEKVEWEEAEAAAQAAAPADVPTGGQGCLQRLLTSPPTSVLH